MFVMSFLCELDFRVFVTGTDPVLPPCLRTGRSPGTHRPLPDGEGQPSRTAAPLHCAGPQAGVGALQRVCAHHQELHPHVHRHQAGVVSFISSYIFHRNDVF